MISADKFAGLLKEGTFFVAEADGMVVGVMGIAFRHIEKGRRRSRSMQFIKMRRAQMIWMEIPGLKGLIQR